MPSKKFSLVTALVFASVSACGPANQSKLLNSQKPGEEPTAMLGDISINASFRFDLAKPVIINGTPVIKNRYWSCVETVSVKFSRPMRLATVLGNTFITGRLNDRHALTLADVDANFQTFTWSAASLALCNDTVPADHVTIDKSVWASDGTQLGTDRTFHLAFPENRNTALTENLTERQDSAQQEIHEEIASMAAAAPSVCVGASPNCFTTTPQRVNLALAALRTWERTERTNALYQTPALKLLPLEYLLQPFAAANRSRQYGAPDTLYVLRRAAHFVQLLFPDLRQIPVADLSEMDGSTPHSGDIQLHPDGAHQFGRDADVAYVTTGTGNDAGASYDWERNFWFLYGALRSTGVDLVITAYKGRFVAMAQQAFSQGLINSHAVGRFSSLMEDSNLNHDKHMHIAVSNLLNRATSRRFMPSDDVYNCYLALGPVSGDGSYNFCETN